MASLKGWLHCLSLPGQAGQSRRGEGPPPVREPAWPRGAGWGWRGVLLALGSTEAPATPGKPGEKPREAPGLAGFREEMLRRILARYEVISLDRMARLLKFENPEDLEAWLLTLPEDTPLTIRENRVLIRQAAQEEIDGLIKLIEQIEETPQARKAKKEEE